MTEAEQVFQRMRETIEKHCGACGRELAKGEKCPDCEKRLNEEHEKNWKSFCPLDYRVCDQQRLPKPEKLEEVLKWEMGSTGLVLHGDTGTGKTRCAWALLRKLHDQKKWWLGAIDSMAGLRYASKYSRDACEVERWVERLIKRDVLLMDDIFKNKLTESFEGVLFTIIDQRVQNQKPTILTSNDTGETLIARMTEDRGAPLLRRLREHCTQINF